MSDVKIGSGNINGKGVYADRDFKEDEVVIKYHLTPLTTMEYEKLPKDKKPFVHTHDGKKYLYAEPERYVNHSSSPNTKQDFGRKCDIATEDIKKGEMITTDREEERVEIQ